MKKFLSALMLSFIILTQWYAETKTPLDAAIFLAGEGIIADKTENPTEFRLLDTITRKEVMKIVMKLSGKTIIDECNGSFSDVSADWGCKYIESALRAGYIAENPTFRPDDNITKTEAMKLVLKAKNIAKTQVTDNWQEDYMETAYEYGIIERKYSDYNADASRGWIFQITTSTIEKEEEIKIKVQEREKLMSDEAMMR